MLNEAFLERFALTFEQDYPTPKIEQKILEGISLDLGLEDRGSVRNSQWADIIRKTFNDGGIDEVISTSPGPSSVPTLFRQALKSSGLCQSFDDETKIHSLNFMTN